MPRRSLSPGPALLLPLAAVARQLLALQLAPLLAAWTLLAWAQTAVAAAFGCRPHAERRHCPALVIAYRRCVGGYHSDLQAAWAGLEKAATAAAPGWRRLPRATLFFDDQVNYPADCCRSLLGFVLAAGCADPEAQAAAWRTHPAVAGLGLAVGVLPAGACLAVYDLPCCGPLSYLLCLLRALHCLRGAVKATGAHAQVPGLVELLDPGRRRLAFQLPLDRRADLLPF